MSKSRYVQVRLTEKQYSLLQNQMEYLGYKTLSQFARDRLFMDGLQTITLLKEIKGILIKETAQEGEQK